jgi:phage gp36-like protein
VVLSQVRHPLKHPVLDIILTYSCKIGRYQFRISRVEESLRCRYQFFFAEAGVEERWENQVNK